MVQSLEESLRDALNHLYDPITLRNSPMLEWLRLETANGSGGALRGALEDAIRALRPASRCPETGKGRRYYQILYYRYVQQFTQAAVAQRLGLSPRHLRREQDAAILALAQYLYDRYRLVEQGLADPIASVTEPAVEPVADMQGEIPAGATWVTDGSSHRATELAPVLRECLSLAAHLAEQRGVTLEGQLGPLPAVMGPSTVVKQIVLDMLAPAIAASTPGRVSLTAHCCAEGLCQSSASQGARVEIVVRVADVSGDLVLSESWDEAVEISRRLAGLLDGALAVAKDAEGVAVTVTLPAAAQIAVLAIEDNADTLQLWQRYVEGSPYRLVGERDPHQALLRAEELHPEIIVLDVMLPEIDGWELLGRLRYHPVTQHTPVLVCTVHPQRDLAMSLGAKGFLRKPTTRQEFLAALEAQTVAREPL